MEGKEGREGRGAHGSSSPWELVMPLVGEPTILASSSAEGAGGAHERESTRCRESRDDMPVENDGEQVMIFANIGISAMLIIFRSTMKG